MKGGHWSNMGMFDSVVQEFVFNKRRLKNTIVNYITSGLRIQLKSVVESGE